MKQDMFVINIINSVLKNIYKIGTSNYSYFNCLYTFAKSLANCLKTLTQEAKLCISLTKADTAFKITLSLSKMFFAPKCCKHTHIIWRADVLNTKHYYK